MLVHSITSAVNRRRSERKVAEETVSKMIVHSIVQWSRGYPPLSPAEAQIIERIVAPFVRFNELIAEECANTQAACDRSLLGRWLLVFRKPSYTRAYERWKEEESKK